MYGGFFIYHVNDHGLVELLGLVLTLHSMLSGEDHAKAAKETKGVQTEAPNEVGSHEVIICVMAMAST